MMGIVVFFACVSLCRTIECAPVDTSSYGTLAGNDFSNNLGMINQNMYNGVTALSEPLFKFAIDTAPNLAHLYAIFNGANVPPSFAALAKELYGNMAVGGGKMAGNTAVLASSVLGSLMNVGSHGLQAGNNIVEAAGKSGINLAGKLGDYAESGTAVGVDILASGLKTLGDVMEVGSAGVKVTSQGISGVLDAIGVRIVTAIASIEKTASQLLDSNVKVLQNGVLQFADKANERVYQGLVAYVQILTHVQNLINLFASTVVNANSIVSTFNSNLGLGFNATVVPVPT